MTVRIKYGEGQTLLTLARLAIVAVACLFVGGAAVWAQRSFDWATQAGSLLNEAISGESAGAAGAGLGQPTALYYSEQQEQGGQTRVYQVFYITGSGDALGLTDAAGNRLLDEVYQGVEVLPHAYLLQQNNSWQFYDRQDLQLLSDQAWDEVELLRAESGAFVSDLLAVRRGELYGAVDMRGQLLIEPVYELFQLSSLQANWPLIRVRRDGLYGFINEAGQVVVTLSYDYAALDSVTVYADENDAEGVETPIVYVRRGEDWGAIYRLPDGSSSDVDWQVEPTEAVLSAYQQEI